VRGHADFLTNLTAGRGCGWVSEENYSARLMPTLSKQSDTTIEAQRDV
jgi:hypothetical protein